MLDGVRIHERGDEVLVNPAISREKFDREIAAYHSLQDDHRKAGRWLLNATFPDVLIAFAVPNVRPHAVAFGALINFQNYDLWPPSVTLVNPFTGVPWRMREIPSALRFNRRTVGQIVNIPEIGPVNQEIVQALLVSHSPEDIPFVCVPGIREYHDHPAHTGDSWLLHRAKGEGTLFFILDVLHRYGVAPIRGFQIGMQITDFLVPEVPQ